MDPHRIELAREVVIGSDAFSRIPEIVKKLGLKGPALLISGSNTYDVAGREVEELLKDRGFSVKARIVGKVNHSALQEALRESKNSKFVLGVGGGRIIDTSKYIGTEKELPFLSVPTAPSHDGIASSRATINKKERKHSYEADAPAAIVADLDVIANAPYDLVSAGCGDLISNLTAVEDWKLGNAERDEYYSDYAAALSVLSAEIVIKSADMIADKEERGIRNLVKALISAGIAMSIAGSSRPCSGAEHQFSHALDNLEKSALHGHQCAVGTLISGTLHGMDLGKIRGAMDKLGIPMTAKELPFTQRELVEAWEEAKNIRDRYTVLERGSRNPKDLLKEADII